MNTTTKAVQAEAAWEITRISLLIHRAIRPSIDTLHQQSIDNNNEISIDNRPIPNTTVQAEAAWEITRISLLIHRAIRPSIDTLHQQSIDNNNEISIDNRPIPNTTVSEKDKFDNQLLTPDEFGIFRDPDGYKKAIDGRTLRLSREDIADNLQTTNGADNLFMHHRNNPEQKATKEFYDTACGIDNSFIQKSRHPTQTSIDVAVPTSVARQPEFGRRTYDLYGNMEFYWEEKDEYGV
ncbi:hypothetical protein F2Q70_00021527 [Brassica cretica]|uniref:Uncharacterized protein n=1 Tax=Brassica cretica TaxID=69181 RepID=A0A8S9GPB5_BRACR|nr:hypothetical protein F2Q70_00021527 [Brassica cretica]